jgi:3-oxoacyl-[acyl-carrier-protein] synthase II
MVAGRRRVVITGIGCVTPLGLGVEPLWKNLMAGGSGVGLTTVFDASRFPTKISAEVRNWDISDEGQDPARWRFCGRHTKFAAGAALQAMKDAGLPHGLPADPTRLGVYLGSGEGQQDFASFTRMMNAAITGDVLDVAKFTKEGLETLHPLAEVEQEPNMPAGHLAGLFNAQGPNLNCLTACAASSQAIGEATEIVRRGEADVMLSGGTHSMIHPFGVTGFNLLTALSTRNDEPTRLRARRGGGHGGARRIGACKATWRTDSRRTDRLRFDSRRLPHYRHASRGPGSLVLHSPGTHRRGAGHP